MYHITGMSLFGNCSDLFPSVSALFDLQVQGAETW